MKIHTRNSKQVWINIFIIIFDENQASFVNISKSARDYALVLIEFWSLEF